MASTMGVGPVAGIGGGIATAGAVLAAVGVRVPTIGNVHLLPGAGYFVIVLVGLLLIAASAGARLLCDHLPHYDLEDDGIRDVLIDT